MHEFLKKYASFLSCFLFFLVLASFARAGEGGTSGFDLMSGSGPMAVTADKLVVRHAENTAEFSGNVTATQGDTRVTADMIKIWYRETRDQGLEKPDQNAVKKVLAQGKVAIVSRDLTAFGDKAVYLPETRDLTLEGRPARLIRGQDTVSGAVISGDSDKTIQVTGTKGAQVEGVFHVGEKSP